MGDTKVVYHIGDEDTPYLVYVPLPPEEITLGDFTREINKAVGYRYYFKTLDDDMVVKKEIKDPDVVLPCYHGRVVAWIVPSCANGKGPSNGLTVENTRLIPSRAIYDDSDASSVISDGSSIMSSEIESTSVMDSDEDRTRDPRQRMRRRKRKKVPKPVTRCSSYSSMTESSSSMNIITVTLDMENISYLGMSIYGSSDDRTVPAGIYVGKIYKGGAVEADGRISTGDIILTVNDLSFENIGNDEAAKVLKDVAQKPGPITFVIAKANWDSQELIGDYGADYSDADTISIASSTCLDPTAQWIQQQRGTVGSNAEYSNNFNYQQNNYFSTNYSLYSTGSESPSNSQIGGDTIRGYHQPTGPLNSNSNLEDVVRVMAAPGSGLEIKERTWLKVTIPDAFIGQDLVKWLKDSINGLSDHKDARKYASNMLKMGYICNTVNKSEKFSDQCYYICGNGTKTTAVDGIKNDMQVLTLDPGSQRASSNYSWGGKPPGSVRSHGSGGTASSSSPRSVPRGMVTAHGIAPSSSGSSQPPSYSRMGGTNPPSYHSYMSAMSASQRSGFAPVKHPNHTAPLPPRPLHNPALGSNLQRADSISSIASSYSQHSMLSMGRPLGNTPSSVAGSQASFRMAIDNPVEYFSDAV